MNKMTELLTGLLPDDMAHGLLYLAVFVAVCVPIAFCKRDDSPHYEINIRDWHVLPGVFRVVWRPIMLLETTFGVVLASIFRSGARRYAELAEISSLPLEPRQVFVCKMIYAPILGALAALLHLLPGVPTVVSNAAIVIMSVLGWMMPSLALDAAAKKRQEEIVKSLPFAIDLMGSAMKAGLDFGAAMRYYTNLGTGGALEYEFSRVLRDASLGKPIAESLQDMAGRVRIKTFTAFAGVIAYGTEIGASISETLKVHGAEMRRERFSLAEQKAARAPSVMIFPLAVFIMPAVFLIIFVPVIMQFIASRGE